MTNHKIQIDLTPQASSLATPPVQNMIWLDNEHDHVLDDHGDVYDDHDDADDGNLRKAFQEEWWQGQARLLGRSRPRLSAPFSLVQSLCLFLGTFYID